MPDLSFSGTINCCSNHDFSLSNSVPFRPATSPNKIGNKTTSPSQDRTSAKNSTGAFEVRATPEEDLKEDLLRESSDDVSVHDKLNAIFEGHAMNNDGDRCESMKPKNSSSTLILEAVSQKLKKHLSRDKGFSKRRSRSSVGTSEEEIERRAELRRIRRKRIQEELSNETLYDDDANSLSSVVEKNLAPDIKLQNLWVPGSTLPLPALPPPSLSLTSLSLPRFAPLQKYGGSSTDVAQAPKLQSQIERDLHLTLATPSKSKPISRRHSSPLFERFDLSFADPRQYVPIRNRSPNTKAPRTPLLGTSRLPSGTELNKSSWRLSFTLDKRGEKLRILSHGASIPATLGSDGLQCASKPSKRWLYSQGLRARSEVATATDDSVDVTTLPSRIHGCMAAEDFGSVDGSQDTSTVFKVPDISTSQLASRLLQNSSASSQLLTRHFYQRGDSIPGDCFHRSKCVYARQAGNTSASNLLSKVTPGALVKSSQDDKTGLTQLKSEVVYGTQSSHQCYETWVDSQNCPAISSPHSLQILKRSLPNVFGSSTPFGERRSLIDDNSLFSSETESFREREVELKTIKSRFPSISGMPSTPKASKFKEEFDFKHSSAQSVEPKLRKESTFTRLKRFSTRNIDGSAGIEDLIDVPPAKPQPAAETHRSTLSPLGDDKEVITIWGRAFKKIADERIHGVGHFFYFPGKPEIQSTREESIIGSEKKNEAVPESISVGERENASIEYQNRFQKRLAINGLAMEDWEAEVAASAKRAQAKGREILKKAKPPKYKDRRFPGSWARYPSHTRTERTSSARFTDKVASRDFALRVNTQGEEAFQKCLEIDGTHMHKDHSEWKTYQNKNLSVRERIADWLSQAVYKVNTSGGGSNPFEFQTSGRRGSMMAGKELKFSELEILPFTPTIIQDQMPPEINKALVIEINEERDKYSARMAEYPTVPRRVDWSGSSDTPGNSRNGRDSKISNGKNIAPKNSVYKEIENPIDTKLREDEDDLTMIIADPKFYEGCIPSSADYDTDEDAIENTDNVLTKGFRKEKFNTWNGSEWDNHKNGLTRRGISLGTVVLRNSRNEN